MSRFSFSVALGMLKDGGCVTRLGWNGPNQYLELQTPDEHSKMTLGYVFIRTVQGDLVPWLCSQTDMLADDWTTVEPELGIMELDEDDPVEVHHWTKNYNGGLVNLAVSCPNCDTWQDIGCVDDVGVHDQFSCKGRLITGLEKPAGERCGLSGRLRLVGWAHSGEGL